MSNKRLDVKLEASVYPHMKALMKRDKLAFERKHKVKKPISLGAILWVAYLEAIDTIKQHYTPDDFAAIMQDERIKAKKKAR
jgi:hypothetical protein